MSSDRINRNEIIMQAICERGYNIRHQLTNKVESLKDDVSYTGQRLFPVEEKFVPIHGILNLSLYQSYTAGMKCSTIVTLVNMQTQTHWEVTHWIETVTLDEITHKAKTKNFNHRKIAIQKGWVLKFNIT